MTTEWTQDGELAIVFLRNGKQVAKFKRVSALCDHFALLLDQLDEQRQAQVPVVEEKIAGAALAEKGFLESVSQSCTQCNGTGDKASAGMEEICPECAGSGKIAGAVHTGKGW